MIAEKFPVLRSLSSEEKLILVGELWDELAAEQGAFPSWEDHLEIIRDRMSEYRLNPENLATWEEIRARIVGSR